LIKGHQLPISLSLYNAAAAQYARMQATEEEEEEEEEEKPVGSVEGRVDTCPLEYLAIPLR
jgi:hypothetical protein